MKSNTEKLLNGAKLLEALFAPPRPSERWLRKMTQAKIVPKIAIGGLTRYDPEAVRKALKKHETKQ